MSNLNNLHQRRTSRNRTKLRQMSNGRPRLSVFRSSKHIYAQIIDDLQGVTLVTRGEDLLPSTDVHRLLQALLGLPTPDYEHHPLIRDSDGRRLAKRDGAPALAALRQAGRSPAEVRAMAGFPD